MDVFYVHQVREWFFTQVQATPNLKSARPHIRESRIGSADEISNEYIFLVSLSWTKATIAPIGRICQQSLWTNLQVVWTI
jgi:hypothetical protein